MPGRLLADTDALLLDILIPACSLGEHHVQERMAADYMNWLPYVRAYRWAGAAIDPRFLDSAVIDVHVYAVGRTAALDLAETCRTALYEAWQNQTIYPHGSIASYSEQAAPTELPSAIRPDGLTTVQATYRLGVCPPLTP
jgi:hypothetical protein